MDQPIAMHRYLIRLENRFYYQPHDAIRVLIELRKLVDDFRSVVKNLRITGSAIEFDLYALNEESKIKSLAKLGEQFGGVLTERALDNDENIENKETVVKISSALFNEERYWECHETMEQIWRKEKLGLEKSVQQGIILAASALVHFQKNEPKICLGMLPRTLNKLKEWHEVYYYVINIQNLKKNLARILVTGQITLFKI